MKITISNQLAVNSRPTFSGSYELPYSVGVRVRTNMITSYYRKKKLCRIFNLLDSKLK